jgi:hypothetical protein
MFYAVSFTHYIIYRQTANYKRLQLKGSEAPTIVRSDPPHNRFGSSLVRTQVAKCRDALVLVRKCLLNDSLTSRGERSGPLPCYKALRFPQSFTNTLGSIWRGRIQDNLI